MSPALRCQGDDGNGGQCVNPGRLWPWSEQVQRAALCPDCERFELELERDFEQALAAEDHRRSAWHEQEAKRHAKNAEHLRRKAERADREAETCAQRLASLEQADGGGS